MPQLTEERFQRIASRITELSPDPLKGYQGFLNDLQDQFRTDYLQVLKRVGYQDVAVGVGPQAVGDVWALDFLVSLGAVDADEARAYMAQRYPAQDWGRAQWGGQTAAELEREASEARAQAGAPDDLARDLRSQAFEGARASVVDSPAGLGTAYLDAFPRDYDANLLHETVQDGFNRVGERLESLSRGDLELQPNSLDGGVLRPGSVSAYALRTDELQRVLQAVPTEEQALRLSVAPSESADRWVGSTGPGRIWSAQGRVETPESYDPGMWPQRYRLVEPGQRYGVLSMRLPCGASLAGDFAPGFDVSYGAVVSNIPHYLKRPPVGLLAAEAVGDPPVAFSSSFRDGEESGNPPWPGTPRLFHDSANSRYQTSTYPFLTTFGSDSLLIPSADELAGCRGVAITVITGKTGGEVYRQLNSRAGLGRVLVEGGQGPSATVPRGTNPEPPAPANALEWDGTKTSAATYTHKTESDDLSSVTRLVQGVPFTPADCAKLVATDRRFSVVVEFLLVKRNGPYTGTAGAAPTWGDPGDWPDHGIRTVGTSPRSWAIDIIVY